MPLMFPDSNISRLPVWSKAAFIVSNGLGPYFKKGVTYELNESHTYYNIQIDETPIPEPRCQQLDVVVRYFSDAHKHVVVEYLCSLHLSSTTSDILLVHVKEAIQDLPQRNMLCFYSNRPNIMRSLKEDINPSLLDMSECTSQKVHNAFAIALEAFGESVESTLLNLYNFFKKGRKALDCLKMFFCVASYLDG